VEEDGPLFVVVEAGGIFFLTESNPVGDPFSSLLVVEASALCTTSCFLRSGEDGTLSIFLASSSISRELRNPSLDVSLYFLLETYKKLSIMRSITRATLTLTIHVDKDFNSVERGQCFIFFIKFQISKTPHILPNCGPFLRS